MLYCRRLVAMAFNYTSICMKFVWKTACHEFSNTF